MVQVSYLNKRRKNLLAQDRLLGRVLQAIGGNQVSLDSSHLVAFHDLRDERRRSIQSLLDALGRGESIPTRDQKELVHQLEAAYSRLKQGLEDDAGFPSVTGDERLRKISAMIAEGVTASPEQNERRRRILDLVRTHPGLFVSQLHQLYLRHSPESADYSTVLDDVNTLESSGTIISIGGPQGNRRYCFPHPHSLDSWDIYYDRFFLMTGRLDAQLREGVSSQRGSFTDLFEFESERGVVLLVTKSSRLRIPDRKPELWCAGRLLRSDREGWQAIGLARFRNDFQVDYLMEAAMVTEARVRNRFLYEDRDIATALTQNPRWQE